MYQTAASDIAPGGSFVNGYTNETDPAETVLTDDATFTVEP